MRVCLITLGCDKNTVDNEYLAGLLADRGYEIVPEPSEHTDFPERLDAVIVTTCGFIGDAKEQSIETILRVATAKRETGNPRRLFVAGCLAQRYAKELLAEIPEIDGIGGVGQFETMAALVDQAPSIDLPRVVVESEPTVEVTHPMRRHRLDAKPYAFLKIADGCDHTCSFCSIPLMKGRLRSVAPDILVQEARDLLAQGVRELNLVAQDVAAYGIDHPEYPSLPELLRRLCHIDGDFWIRCLYCYPSRVTPELIEVLATEPKIVPYLDIPVQHFDAEILRRMNRPGYDIDTVQLANRLREAIPGLALRTTLITGFPGETPAAHTRNLAGIRSAQFDWLGAFRYSPEEGTVAATAPRHVSEKTSQKRWQELLEAQVGVTEARNQERVGRTTRILLEEYDAPRNLWTGRSPWHAPEVDGRVYVTAPAALHPGDFIDAVITRADIYDLYATMV